MTLRTMGLGLIAAVGLGCVSVGQEFDTTQVPALEIGVSQRQDVVRLLGEPWRTGIEDGLPTWTYAHYRYSVFSPVQTRDLIVRFDAEGVVRSYGFNSTYPEDREIGR